MDAMRHRAFRAALIVSVALTLGCINTRAEQPVPTEPHLQLERGWQIPGTGFTLGGYATEDFTIKKHKPWELNTEDLSLFIGWEGAGKLKFFSELSLEEALVFKRPGKFTTGQRCFGIRTSLF